MQTVTPHNTNPKPTKPNFYPSEYLLSLLRRVSPEMQLWLLSHVHQMNEACNSFRSWPIFSYFKDSDLFPYLLERCLIISDGDCCSKMQQFCVNNESDSVIIPNAQMGFIFKIISVFTNSCYYLRSYHILSFTLRTFCSQGLSILTLHLYLQKTYKESGDTLCSNPAAANSLVQEG